MPEPAGICFGWGKKTKPHLYRFNPEYTPTIHLRISPTDSAALPRKRCIPPLPHSPNHNQITFCTTNANWIENSGHRSSCLQAKSQHFLKVSFPPIALIIKRSEPRGKPDPGVWLRRGFQGFSDHQRSNITTKSAQVLPLKHSPPPQKNLS